MATRIAFFGGTAVRALDAERAGRRFAGEPETPRRTGLRDMVETYLAYCKGNDMAAKSLSRYKAALDALLRHCDRERVTLASDLTLPLLESFQSFRIDREGCKPKTAYNDSIIIKGITKWASHPGRRLLQSNPADGWRIREPVTEEPYCYTDEEVRKLTTECRESLRPVVTTLAYTGLRIGELVHLRPQDIDLDAGLILIRAREGWCPKGRRDRAVPLTPVVREVVASRLDGERVFTAPRGGQVRENHTLRAFKKDRARLGILRGGLHSFRHFFVSWVLRNGADPATVMRWVGHRSGDILLRYQHMHERDSRNTMERVVNRSRVAQMWHSGGVDDSVVDAACAATS